MCGGRKVVAFAITLTKEGNHLDGAAVLAASIGENLAVDYLRCSGGCLMTFFAATHLTPRHGWGGTPTLRGRFNLQARRDGCS